MNVQTVALSIAVYTGLAAAAQASPTDTAAVGNNGMYLVQDATCQDVVDAYDAIPNTTTEQALLIMNSLTFQHGYAFAKGITPDEAWDEIMGRCFQDLSQPFAGFPK